MGHFIGEGPIYFTSFYCDGSEETLLECPHTKARAEGDVCSQKYDDMCSHLIDAGVKCKSELTPYIQ